MKFQDRRIRTCFVLWSILTALVSSCSLTIERLDQPIATILPSATLPVVAATATPLPITTAIPTSTAPQTTEVSVAQECIPIEEEMPDDLVLSGVWVRNRGKPYLEPMEGGTAYGVPLKGGGLFSTSRGDIAVSPDGKSLAYIDSYLDETGKNTRSRILRIINSSGHSLPMDYWIINWQWLIGWTDSQHIAIFTGSKEILILAPFTGRWEKLRAPAWLDELTYGYYGNDGPFYSPSLDTMLIRPDYLTLELKDFQTGQTIYEGGEYLNDWDFDWSADGSTLVVSSGDLLNIIKRNQSPMELAAGKFGIDRFDDPKLSPDGQNLVFTSHGSGKWFLFDMEQSEIRKLCSDEFDYWENAVWSPDSRFVVQEVDGQSSDPFDLLIDTKQMRAYKLVSGQYQHRLVWLNEP